MRSPARTGRSRGVTAFDQNTDGFGAIDNIAGADGLACLGESAQRFGVGLDLSGFPQGEIGLDGMDYRLMHAAVIFRGNGSQRCVEIGRKS
jgi:hypothetical protein